MWRITCAVGILLAAVGCSGSTSAPSTTPATLHGELSDPIGDTASDPRVPVPPDLVHATVDIAAGNLTLVVALAPGTLDRPTTRVTALLDTDQNGQTGIRQTDGIGADYALDLDASTGLAAINKADPVGCAAHLSCFTGIGSAPITFVPSGMQVVVSLATLGATDGHMTFQLMSYVYFPPPLTAVDFDFMADNNLPPGRVQ